MAITRVTGAVETKSLVAFEVGEILYAADIARVREIVRPMPTMPLPMLPPSVVGVVDHRGEVVPIIDLRIRFGIPEESRSTVQRWVIVRKGARLTGLIVDAVTEVFGGNEPQHRELPDFGSGDVERGISTVYSHRGRLVFVLDIDALVAPGEQVNVAIARDQLSSWRPDAP